MIVGSVVALHVAGIWALQSGLVRKAAEVIVPAELLSEFIAPPCSHAGAGVAARRKTAVAAPMDCQILREIVIAPRPLCSFGRQ